jgi:acetyl-CoA decarbonylase/synthase complex subunit delta
MAEEKKKKNNGAGTIAELMSTVKRLELENVSIEADELVLELTPSLTQVLVQMMGGAAPGMAAAPGALPKKVGPFKFEAPIAEWKQDILEVTLGATKEEGGTRDYSVVIGGQKTMPFYTFEANVPNIPVFSFDIFDMELSLPKAVRMYYDGVMDSPIEWAKTAIERYNAKMITLHLISTDPINGKDTSPEDSAALIEDMLKEIKVPMIISGSGNRKKDPPVLVKAAEAASGERVLLSAALSDNYETIAPAVIEHNHAVLALATMDPAAQKTLTRALVVAGVPRNSIVMDTFTGSLGYGVEYTITTMERIRQMSFRGDKDLNYPILSGTSNAWAAREAWRKNDAWGEKLYRGPLWEATTGLMALLSGSDIFMMLHPGAIEALQSITEQLLIEKDESKPMKPEQWIKGV